jgi:D-aspartate ligase
LSGAGVLLLGADSYGTLAAARCYKRHGINVSVANEGRFARTMFSRCVDERLIHPPLADRDAFFDWLCAWGERHPGTLVYPSTDDLAWLLAVERERLRQMFRMLSPGEATMIALLDKVQLRAWGAEFGIDTPHSVPVVASTEADEVAAGTEGLSYPLLLKPRTRVLLQGGVKGFIVRDRTQLAGQLARYRKLVTFHETFMRRHPDLAQPIVQEYVGAAETSILSVAGFVAGDGRSSGLASMKVLQRPRKLGIGLCFEERELEEPLLEKLVAMCRKVEYEGVFEAEFVVTDGRQLLIDFNPRFYSQIGFEVARGLPLPLLVWETATGERTPTRGRHARPTAASGGGAVYCHKTLLGMMLVLQRLSGRMSGTEVKRWRAWQAEADARGALTDAVRDAEDALPAFVDAAKWIISFLRHPRDFINSFVLNR